jgi:hypothetical protein
VVENGITYLCLADEDQKRRIPFEFLEDIKKRFQEAYGDRARTAIAFAMNQEFQHELQRRMVRCRGPCPLPAAPRACALVSRTHRPDRARRDACVCRVCLPDVLQRKPGGR